MSDNDKERILELEGLLREVVDESDVEVLGSALVERIDATLAGQPQQGERCQGENCGTTTGQHSRECIEEAARDQGWIPTEEDFKGYAKPEQPAAADEREVSDVKLIEFAVDEQFLLFCDEDEFVQIARSVLEKFGQARAALAPAAVVIPEGYALVPIEPTLKMIKAGDLAYSFNISKVYAAMLDAAPAPVAVPAHHVCALNMAMDRTCFICGTTEGSTDE